MASVSTSKIYVLKNSFTAAAKILALTNNGGTSLSMIDARNVNPDSLWFLTPTHTPRFYRLHTIANGVKQSLDVINDNGVQSINLELASTGEYSGQYWRFDDWHTNAAYPYRLSNNFTGPNAHLDVYSDTFAAHLAGGDYTGQHWALVPADTVVVTTS
ncbi:hypothetical protein MKX07_004529 [Trichoderma sp. CBMAI-0711]|nr:hypothetical protein MKX07_004529 [Trichoderma sp. CBMAI-0711]